MRLRWGVALAALLALASCSSDGSAHTSTVAANPATSTTAVAPTTAAATTTAPPATSAPTTAAPTTTGPAASAPTTAPPAGVRPAWETTFESLARQPGNTVVDEDNPGGLAVGHPGQWLLVDTTTDRTVDAPIDATVIGVRPADGDKFAVATARADGTVEVLAVSADGSIDALGAFPVDGASPPDGRLPTAAAIAPSGDSLYVAGGVPRQAGLPYSAALARVQDGVTTPLPNPPGYGPITFTDAGELVVTVPSDTRVAGPTENRWISADQGATWRSISIPPGTWPGPKILLGISEQAAVAFDAGDPAQLGVGHADGTVSGAFSVPEETTGWLVVAPDGAANATLVGQLSGQGVTVDRASGAPVGTQHQLFDAGHGLLTAAWQGSDGAIHALAMAPDCVGDCQPTTIVDGQAPAPPATIDGCSWTAAYVQGEGAMGSEYSTVALTNVGATACPVPTIDAVTGTTANGLAVPAQSDDVIGGLGPAPASVQPGAAVQITIVTTTSSEICDAPSRRVTALTLDIGVPLPVTHPGELETACQFRFSQPGTAS